MKKALFEGVCTALVTPFKENSISVDQFKKLLAMQLEAGIRSFVICGTTGEAPTLSEEEKLTLFREAKKFAGSKAVILAGTGSNCTESAVNLSMKAQDQGVDGLLVVSPYYNKCTEAGLLAHYRAIAQAVSIPILLYNVPSRTGVDIPVSVYRELAKLPNIAGVKEASPDLRKVAEIRRACPEDFYVYSGNDDLLLPILSLGGRGVISVASNVKPREMIGITEAWYKGNLQQAQAQFMSLLPLINALFSEVNPIPVKAALRMAGIDCGKCRLPLTDLSPEHSINLKKYL